MLKVLHISGARSWGGNEQQLIDLIHELKIQNVENIVLGVAGSPLEDECLKKYISFIPAKKNKLNKFANYRFLKRITEELKPDVLHLHTSDSLTTFVISDLIYKIKVPSVFSKKGMGKSSSFLSKFKYNYRNISAIICVSERVKEEFSEILSESQKRKLTVIYDGISLARMQDAKESVYDKFNIEENKKVIGHIGNHVHAKDLPTLIRMMNVLVNDLNIKNVVLVQIGEFKEEITHKLKEMIREFGIEDFIILTGFIPDASSYLGQLDVFVMSSEREGFPLTIYEAFYKRIPVVSTKAGGIPEIISDGINGILVDIRDFENMAKKTMELILNEEKRASLEKNASQMFLENYTSEKCSVETLKLYKRLSK